MKHDRRRSTSWVRAVASVTAVAFTALIAHPPAAWAQAPAPVKRVALFVVPKTSAGAGDAKVLQALMRSELERLVGVMSVAGQGEPDQPLKAQVGTQVDQGFRALNDRNPGAAERAFQGAYDAAMRYSGLLDRRFLARILKGLGSAQVMSGSMTSGQELIEASLNLWPDQQLGDYGWTLDLRTAFNEITTRRSSAELGSIEVDSEPTGATIYLDGQLKGFAPVELKDLAPGRHWVETSLDGYRWNGMFVEVPAGSSTIHAPELEKAPTSAALTAALASAGRGLGRGAVAQPMAELATATRSDAVIVLEVSASSRGYTFQGFIRDGGEPRKISKTVAIGGSTATELGAFLAETLKAQASEDDRMLPLDGPPQASVFTEGDIIIDPNDPIFAKKKETDSGSVTEEWWFWTLVGGVTAGLVAGGIVLLGNSSGGHGPSGDVVLRVNSLR